MNKSINELIWESRSITMTRCAIWIWPQIVKGKKPSMYDSYAIQFESEEERDEWINNLDENDMKITLMKRIPTGPSARAWYLNEFKDKEQLRLTGFEKGNILLYEVHADIETREIIEVKV